MLDPELLSNTVHESALEEKSLVTWLWAKTAESRKKKPKPIFLERDVCVSMKLNELLRMFVTQKSPLFKDGNITQSCE